MYLLFDIGGTKMRIGVSSDGGSVDEVKVIPTPKSFDEGMTLFGQSYKELVLDKKVDLAAGGIRRLDAKKERLLPDFRLPDWSEKPLREVLEKITGAPVYLENDTAFCGLGEAVYGSGKGYKIVAYLTVSTGVGGVRIVDSQIDANSFGFEPGHQVVDLDWSKFPSMKEVEDEGVGQLEAYISGASLEKRFGVSAKDITDDKVWTEVMEVLAVALKNTVCYWSPDIIILGGGMINTPGISIPKLNMLMKEELNFFPSIPEVRAVQLGDYSGLYGALAFLKKLSS